MANDQGTWESPISADMVIEARVKFNQVATDNKYVYWSELRPFEKGINQIVRYDSDGSLLDLLPEGYSARTKVHEYGGGDFCVGEGNVFFSNQFDQRLYELIPGKDPKTISSAHQTRFADGVYDQKRKMIYSIHEEGDKNEIVSVDVQTHKMTTLVEGKDFYSSLSLSPDGKKLSYLSWNHPDMSWDECHLSMIFLDEKGQKENVQHIVSEKGVSLFQPQWAADGNLYFVSDKTGFWNLYRYVDGVIETLYTMEADFGIPQWQFGYTTYDFIQKKDKPYIICTYVQKGIGYLALLDLSEHTFKTLKLPFTSYAGVRSYGEKCVFMGASPTTENAMILLDPFSQDWEVIKKSAPNELEKKWISVPKMISFPTTDGDVAHAIFYPPQNPHHKAKGEKTPLILRCHGGPTGHEMAVFQMETQYWTSRGFAYVELNYRGSSGYGRAYRDKLKGKWGIYDVDDAVKCAEYLVKEKMVDPKKMVIKGGSSGGYTTLAALTFRKTFQAGASFYGVSDLETLVQDTHKFEKHYLDSLVGKYPEEKNIYYERSPIHFIDAVSVPVILFQGSEDKIVPPSQSETVYHSLKKRNIPVEYFLFPGEGHGFRMGETKKTVLIEELAFYQRVLGLKE